MIQVLNEAGKAFDAVQSAKQATDLDPSWCEAWVTRGRCEANLGEPECALDSFDKALELGTDPAQIEEERTAAQQLAAQREQDPNSRGKRVIIVDSQPSNPG